MSEASGGQDEAAHAGAASAANAVHDGTGWAAPLRHREFRLLWAGWLMVNLTLWMNDVAAAWVMASLTTSPIMVALVQSASSLPVFLLGIPSGAVADIVDRRRLLIVTQIWAAGVALVMCITSLTGVLVPALLLFLTLCSGIGLAMRMPPFAAVVPELVPRAELPAAMALNGISMNASRVLGPVIAGAIIAAFGSGYVFVANAVLAAVVITLLVLWRHPHKVSRLPSERFFAAMRVGLQHARESRALRAILVRAFVFLGHSVALLALLPLTAKRFAGADAGAGAYTLLLASMGMGAVLMVPILPRLHDRITRDQLARYGTWVFAGATTTVAFAPNLYVAVAGMLVAGTMWIAVANTLAVAGQMVLPDWARARGMAMVQVAFMGGSAIGAAVWGQVASFSNVQTGLLASAASAVVVGEFVRRFKVGGRMEDDVTPVGMWKAPELAIHVEPRDGPVLATVEYRIDPADADAFVAVMRESRHSWIASGLLGWELFHDTAEPERYIEHLIDESWVEYVRRHERVSTSYVALREKKLAFHRGPAPPVVTRYLARHVGHR